MNTKKSLGTCLVLLFIFSVHVMSQYNDKTFKEKVLSLYKQKPLYIKCMHQSKINHSRYNEGIIKALQNKFEDFPANDVVAIIYDQKEWRINREDFTGRIRNRYMYLYLVMKSNNSKEYLVIHSLFMQDAKFFGLTFGKTYLRQFHYLNKIMKNNYTSLCK